MKLLHDLLHRLSKDEKRLYRQHRKPGRFQLIYDAYLAHKTYDKSIDRELYENAFADVSKPFYSMQKRGLLDDVVTVLFTHSNQQQTAYNELRAYAKGRLLLERNQPLAAKYYLNEAAENATQDPALQLAAVHAQVSALVTEPEASFAEFEERFAAQRALTRQLQHEQLRVVRRGLELLQRNPDKFSDEERRTKADTLMQIVQELPFSTTSTPELELETLQIEGLYHELRGEPETHHRKLAARLRQFEAHGEPEADGNYLCLLNQTLRSGLLSGDFLLLSSLIYRTEKLLHELPEGLEEAFLPDYLETTALYHFYDNDLQQALRDTERLLNWEGIDAERRIRVTYYRLGMLLVAHLAEQAGEQLHNLISDFPELENKAESRILQVMIDVDRQLDLNEITFTIERHKNALRKQQTPKAALDNLQQILLFAEKRPFKPRFQPLFPLDWEQVIRVDHWLQAKLDNEFYYNYLLEEWQKRKRVFN